MAHKESVEVLGVPLWASDIPAATARVLQIARELVRHNLLISATGAHGLVYGCRNPGFGSLLRRFAINLPDGMPGVWIGRIKKARGMKRCYGPDFFRAVMLASADSKVKHFFCGGNPGVAEDLRQTVGLKFGNHNVAGVFCPPYLPVGNYDYAAIADTINSTGADVVWIGLSTPKQESFAEMLSKHTTVACIITVGAAFDFHTGRVRQAPAFIQRAGLEWLFRLSMEPRRLFKRYFEIVPLFIYYNILELFGVAKGRQDDKSVL
jgi:N-acetylglucosaminyldiphosphoundecaprenol N-acetyl-beta-D-mannosaminyltransferase